LKIKKASLDQLPKEAFSVPLLLAQELTCQLLRLRHDTLALA
jgi:hypothetical protein